MEQLELQTIKKRISLARKEAGYTQEQMAKLLGISQPAYSCYETGDKPLPTNKISLIAQIVNRPSSFFLGDIATQMEKEDILKNITKQLEIVNQHLANLVIGVQNITEQKRI